MALKVWRPMKMSAICKFHPALDQYAFPFPCISFPSFSVLAEIRFQRCIRNIHVILSHIAPVLLKMAEMRGAALQVHDVIVFTLNEPGPIMAASVDIMSVKCWDNVPSFYRYYVFFFWDLIMLVEDVGIPWKTSGTCAWLKKIPKMCTQVNYFCFCRRH